MEGLEVYLRIFTQARYAFTKLQVKKVDTLFPNPFTLMTMQCYLVET